jgi:hypothetical protein
VLNRLQRRVAGDPVDLFISFEHQFNVVQNSSDHRIRAGKSGDTGGVQRFDYFESGWQGRSRVPETLDHVGELSGQHVGVARFDENMLSLLSSRIERPNCLDADSFEASPPSQPPEAVDVTHAEINVGFDGASRFAARVVVGVVKL